MAAVVLRQAAAIKASPPHPSAASLGSRADAAKAKFETGYRRAQAPEWLVTALGWLAGLGAFLAAWALLARYGGRIPDPAVVGAAAVVLVFWIVATAVRRMQNSEDRAALVGMMHCPGHLRHQPGRLLGRERAERHG